jgi:cyclophilin family peptidyl-prolyl cis-trans isomerase
MRFVKIGFTLMVWLLFMSAAFAQVKDKKFTPEEIKKMAETTAVIETKFGNIEIKFFPDVAPNHVKNFIDLAKKGFYDGTTFHRVIPGFMIQGGDPNTKSPDRSKHGMGGPGYALKAEFNEKPHKRGTLSMARAASPDSAGSQFFICVAPASFLDKQYTVFGEVVSGMEVVDKIVSQPRDKKDNPNDRIEMKVKIVEKQG